MNAMKKEKEGSTFLMSKDTSNGDFFAKFKEDMREVEIVKGIGRQGMTDRHSYQRVEKKRYGGGGKYEREQLGREKKGNRGRARKTTREKN